jgi:hypothetical protein
MRRFLITTFFALGAVLVLTLPLPAIADDEQPAALGYQSVLDRFESGAACTEHRPWTG